MGHNHDHGDLKGKRLGITILLNLLITVSQVIGGLISGSLSLLSDAAHNFSDVIALIISWIADRLTQKKYSKSQTYGYKRAEVLAALINVVTILVIAVNIFIEGIQRFSEPQIITGTTVIFLAGLSILVNGLSVLIIKNDAKDNMNMKSAYLHLFSDMLTSIAVLVGGVIIYYFKIYWIDGVISLVIATYLIFTSTKLLLETLRVLMQFTPKNLDLDDVKKAIEKMDCIQNIHHVHVWQLTDHEIHFSGHIAFNEDIQLSVVNQRLEEIKKMMHDQFHIEHVTLEAEYRKCDEKLVIDERKHDHHH